MSTQTPMKVTYAARHALAQPGSLARWPVAVVMTARPRQWPKNLLVFAAPLAAASLGRDDGLAYALVSAAAFLCASVVFVASGFLLRVLGGAAATHVPPSGWFLLVCSLGAIGVAIAKRYTELAGLGAAAIRHRPVLRWYRPAILRLSQYLLAMLMVVAYLMWASGERASARDWHLASAVALAAALIRFGVLTARRTVTPVEDMLTRDGPMLTCETAVYFVNDVADAERDRRHPVKRYRPVAAGDLPKSHAITVAAVCVAAAMTAGFAIGEPLLMAAAGGYLGMSFLYSVVLKHIPVIERLPVGRDAPRATEGGH